MITINVHKHFDSRDSSQVYLPESWDELKGEQLLNVAEALYKYPEADERHAHICRALIGKQVRTLPPMTLLTDIFPLIQWVYEPPTFTIQKIPAIRAGFRTYYGPETAFYNIRLIEYDFADRELYQYLHAREQGQDGAEQFLWRFVACLYRPGKWLYNRKKDKDGDVRIKFNENTLNWHAGILRRNLPAGFAYAVLLWYKACRKFITVQYSRVFDGTEDENYQPVDELPNHFNLMRKIAEKGTYGRYDEVEQLYLHTALLEIEKSIIEADEMKNNAA